jgi:hypothetical protein
MRTSIYLWPSWAVLGPPWGHLGPSWDHLGPCWGHFKPSWATLRPSQTILGPSWDRLSAILEPSWSHFSHGGAILGTSMDDFETVLGPSGALLGVKLRCVGAMRSNVRQHPCSQGTFFCFLKARRLKIKASLVDNQSPWATSGRRIGQDGQEHFDLEDVPRSLENPCRVLEDVSGLWTPGGRRYTSVPYPALTSG